MNLEESILKLAAAIEANTAAIMANTGAAVETATVEPKKGRKAKEEATPVAQPVEQAPVGPSVQDVRAAAQAVLDANGNDPAPIVALNKEYGVKRIAEVAPEKFADVIAKLKKLAGASAV